MGKRWADMTDMERQHVVQTRGRYREQNRDRENQRARENYAANIEARRAKDRARYAALKLQGPEKLVERRRAQYERTGREYFSAWRESHPQERSQANVQYRKRHPDKVRDAYLKHHYGIGLDEYETMLQQQGGVCAICRRPERGVHHRSGRLRSLAVDHCHQTAIVRGLLCGPCNTALGLLGHDVVVIAAAHMYLARLQK